MKQKRQGTNMWCPECNKVRLCAGVNPSTVGAKSFQAGNYTDQLDINFFKRGRVCQTCKHKFLTLEVEESFLDELIGLSGGLVTASPAGCQNLWFLRRLPRKDFPETTGAGSTAWLRSGYKVKKPRLPGLDH